MRRNPSRGGLANLAPVLPVEPARLLAILAAVLAISALVWWGARGYQRVQMKRLLAGFAPLVSPPMEVQFPARIRASASARSLLAAGEKARFWVVRESANGVLEVLITREGQRYFSTVGSRIVAGFAAGRRSITHIDEVEDNASTRRLRFRYVWSEVHPALVFLGDSTPQPGIEQSGEAMLTDEDGEWKPVHWTAAEFDQAQRHFQSLPAAP